MPEDHACTFPFETVGKIMLEKNNPKVKFEKLEKI